MAYISDVSGIEVQKLLQVFGLFLFDCAGVNLLSIILRMIRKVRRMIEGSIPPNSWILLESPEIHVMQ